MSEEFTVVEPKSKRVERATGPPDALLKDLKDGQKVQGPDGRVWVIKPAIPRRWAEVRKVVRKAKD